MLNRSLMLAGCTVAALAGAARAQSDVYLLLQPGSFYELGCHGACTCPILVHAPLTGSFRLTRTTPDPLFDHYSITDVTWT